MMSRNICLDRVGSQVTARLLIGTGTGELAVGHRPAEAAHGHDAHVLVDGEVVGRRGPEVPVAERVEDRPRRQRLVADRGHHLTLLAAAGDVTECGVGVPRPGVGERDRAVGVLAALLHVEVGQLVVHVVRRTDRDPADGVDDVHEATEPDLDVVVDVDAGVLLDGPDQQLRAAEREGRVDLGRAVAGDRHQRVAGDRHGQRRAAPRVHQHDGVGALAGGVAGVELLALFGGEALARVAADEEVVGARLVGRSVTRWERVDLLDLRPGEERHGDQVDQPEGEQDPQVAEPEPCGRQPPPEVLPPFGGGGTGRGGVGDAVGREVAAGAVLLCARGTVGITRVSSGRGCRGTGRVASGSVPDGPG